MSTRSRARSARSTPRPPLVGRLHEMAIARPVAAPPATQGWWQRPHLAGQVQNPQMVVVGQLGRLGQGVGLSPWGAEMGYDVLSGEKFYCDPMGWVLDEAASVDPFESLGGRAVMATHLPSDFATPSSASQGR